MSTQKTADVPQTEGKNVTRREFLYYVLGASAAALTIEVGGVALWFALPHPHFGVDLFQVDLHAIPRSDADPVKSVEGPYWLSNSSQGLFAFTGFCSLKGTSYKWVSTDKEFRCPVCASAFDSTGNYISGPAFRGLDRYRIVVNTPHGTIQTPDDGSPISIQDATSIMIDIRFPILGKVR